MGNITVRFLRQRLLTERAGNTAMIFALLTPVLVLLGGGVVDLTNASMRQSSLQQAADAAAVGAVARNSPGYLYAINKMSSDGPVPDSVTLTNAQAVFNANWKSSNGTAAPTLTGSSCGGSTLVCKQTSPLSAVTVNSIVTVSSTFTPSFLGLIGQKTIKLSATSKASDNVPAYINFYLLLDNTPSMGLAATTADQAKLQGLTPDSCAFACHDVNNKNSNYTIAQKAGIVTRINNVALATQNLLNTASTTEQQNGIAAEFQVALFDFGIAAGNPQSAQNPYQVFPTTGYGSTSSDLASAASAATTIDLMTVQGNDAWGDIDNDQWGDMDTNISSPYSPTATATSPLNIAANFLTSSGNGISAASPQNVLFFVSDGVNDKYNLGSNNGSLNRLIAPIDTSACAQMQKNGVKIAVLYTTYLPVTNNPFWQLWIGANLQSWLAPWTPPPPNDTIAASMKACASPGLYFEVDSNGNINSAMQALFQKVIASVQISG